MTDVPAGPPGPPVTAGGGLERFFRAALEAHGMDALREGVYVKAPPAAPVEIQCRDCGARWTVPAWMAGTLASCPDCPQKPQ